MDRSNIATRARIARGHLGSLEPHKSAIYSRGRTQFHLNPELLLKFLPIDILQDVRQNLFKLLKSSGTNLTRYNVLMIAYVQFWAIRNIRRVENITITLICIIKDRSDS